MNKKRISIITGKKHSGKTSFLLKEIEKLKDSGIAVGGLVSIGSFRDNSRYDFKLQDISTGEKWAFLSREECKTCKKIGRFYINPKAFDFGNQVLENCLKNNIHTIVLDEIGPLELQNEGWAGIIPELLRSDADLIFTVRKELLEEVVLKWKIKVDHLIEIEL